MKTRKLLAALALVLLGAFAVAGPAGAQDEVDHSEPEGRTEAEAEALDDEFQHFVEELPEEERDELVHLLEEMAEENDGTHADVECIPILVEGGSPEDCHEAPSPIMPEPNELIWGGITFLVLLIGMWKLGLPAVKNMMDTRTERIRAEVDAADAAKAEADRIRQEYSAQLADAKGEAARIIEEARQAADAVRRDLTTRAEAEATELRQRNAEQLEAERARLMSELQGQVAALAIELAEKVVDANLDRDANNRLIESYISQVGTR